MFTYSDQISAYGIAKLYADICSHIVIDTKDRMQTKKIEALGMHVHETSIKMTNKKSEDTLASYLLNHIH